MRKQFFKVLIMTFVHKLTTLFIKCSFLSNKNNCIDYYIIEKFKLENRIQSKNFDIFTSCAFKVVPDTIQPCNEITKWKLITFAFHNSLWLEYILRI